MEKIEVDVIKTITSLAVRLQALFTSCRLKLRHSLLESPLFDIAQFYDPSLVVVIET